MSDDITESQDVLPTRKIAVTVERKLGKPDYGNYTARAWVEGVVDATANESEVSIALGNLFAAATVAVFDQLGISYEMTDEGVVQETGQPPAVTVSGGNNGGAPSGAAPSSGDGGLRVMNPAESPSPIPQWIITEAAKAGITAVWDNRSKVNGNQPHFREAVPQGGTGHGKDGAPKGFWPPK